MYVNEENDYEETVNIQSDKIESDMECDERQCPVCNFDFPSSKALKQHILSHRIVPTFYRCHLCLREFLSTEVLEKHLKLHKNETPLDKMKKFKCLFCIARFLTENELNDHVKKVHNELTKLHCNVCDEEFDELNALKKHEKQHDQKSFKNRKELQKHKKIHDDKERQRKKGEPRNQMIYICRLCEFETPTLSNAREHFQHKHQLKVKAVFSNLKYRCTECSASFETIYEMFQHNNEHTGNSTVKIGNVKKEFTCEICEKPFNRYAKYKMHKKTHSQKWPRKCLYCDFIIEKRGDYIPHMNKNHENLKEYICNLCGKRFFEQKNLTTHLSIHSGERKFMCDICGWKFHAQNNLVSLKTSSSFRYFVFFEQILFLSKEIYTLSKKNSSS